MVIIVIIVNIDIIFIVVVIRLFIVIIEISVLIELIDLFRLVGFDCLNLVLKSYMSSTNGNRFYTSYQLTVSLVNCRLYQ